MKTKQYTDEEISLALIRSAGFITCAAALLGCHYTTVSRAIKRSLLVEEAYRITKERNLDIAESVVITTMEGSDVKEKMDAAKFYLRYKGRERGYLKSSKVEITEDLSQLMRDAEERTK